MLMRVMAASAALLILAACGGGGSDTTRRPPPVQDPPPPQAHPVSLPDAHDLSGWLASNPAGAVTVPAGEHRDVGGVRFSCPAGGADCAVTVTAEDGTIAATSTDGMATRHVGAAAGARGGPARHARPFRLADGQPRRHGHGSCGRAPRRGRSALQLPCGRGGLRGDGDRRGRDRRGDLDRRHGQRHAGAAAGARGRSARHARPFRLADSQPRRHGHGACGRAPRRGRCALLVPCGRGRTAR